MKSVENNPLQIKLIAQVIIQHKYQHEIKVYLDVVRMHNTNLCKPSNPQTLKPRIPDPEPRLLQKRIILLFKPNRRRISMAGKNLCFRI